MQSTPPKTLEPHAEGAPTAVPLRSRHRRLVDVDHAKALAIILVVVGHVSDPQAPTWANALRALIYNFHMPLFMYLSGYIFVYVSAHVMKPNFGRYILARANRLLVPFIVMAIVMVSLKMVGSRYTDLNRSSLDLLDAYKSILIHTQQSPALDLWYLFVLFVFSVATPLLFKLCGGRFWPLLIVSLGMYALFIRTLKAGTLTDDFYVDRICWFYVFFVCGCMACRHSDKWLAFIDRAWPFALLMLVVLDLCTLEIWRVGLGSRFLVLGTLSSVAFHGFTRSRLMRGGKMLDIIAESTLSIYLFNTILVAAARALFVKVASPATAMPMLYVVALAVGLIGPILIRRALSSFPLTRPIVLYIT